MANDSGATSTNTGTGSAGQAGTEGQESTEGQEQTGGQESTETRETDPAKLQAALNKANQTKAQQTAKLKEAEAKAKRWDEHEKAQQSEAQRWEAEKSELSTRASTAETRLAQYDAAAEAGLDLAMAKRVQGGTPEEMLADAKSLAETFGQAAQNGAQQQRAHQKNERRRTDQTQGGSNGKAEALNSDGLTQALMAAVGSTSPDGQ